GRGGAVAGTQPGGAGGAAGAGGAVYGGAIANLAGGTLTVNGAVLSGTATGGNGGSGGKGGTGGGNEDGGSGQIGQSGGYAGSASGDIPAGAGGDGGDAGTSVIGAPGAPGGPAGPGGVGGGASGGGIYNIATMSIDTAKIKSSNANGGYGGTGGIGQRGGAGGRGGYGAHPGAAGGLGAQPGNPTSGSSGGAGAVGGGGGAGGHGGGAQGGGIDNESSSWTIIHTDFVDGGAVGGNGGLGSPAGDGGYGGDGRDGGSGGAVFGDSLHKVDGRDGASGGSGGHGGNGGPLGPSGTAGSAIGGGLFTTTGNTLAKYQDNTFGGSGFLHAIGGVGGTFNCGSGTAASCASNGAPGGARGSGGGGSNGQGWESDPDPAAHNGHAGSNGTPGAAGASGALAAAGANGTGVGPACSGPPCGTGIVPPLAPTIDDANSAAFVGEVDLYWGDPPRNGGSALTGWVLTPYVATTAQAPVTLGLLGSNHYAFHNLVNGTTYTFTVAAKNSAGTGAASAHSKPLTPRSGPHAPSAPRNVTAVAGNGKVTVTWSAPADDGSSPGGILDYSAQVYDAAEQLQGGGSTGSGSIFSLAVTGLTNGTTYHVIVRATTTDYYGAYSAPRYFTPAAGGGRPPGAPASPSAKPGDSKAYVRWSAPSDPGTSTITGYRITPYVGSVAGTPQNVGLTQPAVVTGLTDATAYRFTVAAINSSGPGADSAVSASLTPEPWSPNASWTALVNGAYADLVGRPPTTSERSTAVQNLTSGALTKGQFIADLRSSNDNVTNVDPVTRLYYAYFLRVPDKGGLQFWIGQKRKGIALADISNAFAASSEFKSRYGTLSNNAFVKQVYTNVLGRLGDPGGINYWTAQLDQKKRTRGQVMIGFSESGEYKAKKATSVTVAVLDIALWQKTPTASVATAQIAVLNGGQTTATFAATLLDSLDYATRIEGA
ncbi:MAG: cell wall-binding protein, partial [Acidimicrobiales bacterium]|nr:cell wall-binding protein [Acidimicrobiales bacterium]